MYFIRLLLLFLAIAIPLIEGLECHVCHGSNNQMSCSNDPKSMQYMSCGGYDAGKFINTFMQASNITVSNSTNFSCVFLSYMRWNRHAYLLELVTIRSCLAINGDDDMCTVYKKTIDRKNGSEFQECYQCDVDYCNGRVTRRRPTTIKYFVIISCLYICVSRM